MSERSKTVGLSLRVKPAVVEAVDAYRRVQPTIPTRTEAVEHLIELGFLEWKRRRAAEQEKHNGKSS